MPFAYEEIDGFAIHNHIIQFSLQSSFAPLYISYGRKFWSILFKAFGFHKVCNSIFKFIFWWNK